ncbi:MAG: PIG-L deacetylase family protein [Bryobacteraceae bacterium]
MKPSRRQLFSLPLPLLGASAPPGRSLRVVCTGGHPDDPESGCGGTLARYGAAGASVTIIYMTRGEAGIDGKSHQEAAAIRSAECLAACKILGAKPVFAGQIDGATIVDRRAAESLQELILAEDPDIVFTQWPIDSHSDHQAVSILTYRAWLNTRGRFELFYYEVELGDQTMGFHPTDYVDITRVRDRKKAALFAHKSHGERLYTEYHQRMEDFRGWEAGCTAAEAFVRLARVTNASQLPGKPR